jgi:hypothetical protein
MKNASLLSKKYLLLLLVLLMILLSSNGKAETNSVGPCEKGFAACAISCALTGEMILVCEGFCIYGYAWCITYINPLL